MKVIITTDIPPEISFYFSRILLTGRHGIEGIHEILPLLIEEAKRKYRPNSRKMNEFNKIILAFEGLYEWFEKMEAYQNSTHKKEKEKPYFEINKINLFRGELRAFFLKLFRNGELSRFFSENNDISKV